MDLTAITRTDFLQQGLVNLMKDTAVEPAYAVRHGQKLVNDYGHHKHTGDFNNTHYHVPEHNYWALAFPVLFPYGEGGIEDDWPVPVLFAEHV